VPAAFLRASEYCPPSCPLRFSVPQSAVYRQRPIRSSEAQSAVHRPPVPPFLRALRAVHRQCPLHSSVPQSRPRFPCFWTVLWFWWWEWSTQPKPSAFAQRSVRIIPHMVLLVGGEALSMVWHRRTTATQLSGSISKPSGHQPPTGSVKSRDTSHGFRNRFCWAPCSRSPQQRTWVLPEGGKLSR